MKIKFILPSLTEAEDSFWRPIKYSLSPPLGLATLASYVSDDDEAEIVDQHVEKCPTKINSKCSHNESCILKPMQPRLV